MDADRPAKPQNVILLIGDGMGLTQISAGLYSNNNRLHLERFPVIGLHKSYASNNLVTDSAAGATAFACGKKTYNGAIAVGPDSLPCRTILEDAKARELATGLIATSTIVHATPASFVAHNIYRRNYDAIAADFVGSDLDYFVGGGLQFFRNRESDDRDLYAELEALGYQMGSYFDSEFTEVNPDPSKPFGYLTSLKDPLTVANGRDYLEPATLQALEFLPRRSDQGFFLMVEGSQIDWGGHANNAEYIISEMLEFDRVIGRVLDWAQTHPETLVVVTADHETGGFAIQVGSQMNDLETAFTSTKHTADLIPVFAFGPGAEQFSGIYENTEIYDKIKALTGW